MYSTKGFYSFGVVVRKDVGERPPGRGCPSIVPFISRMFRSAQRGSRFPRVAATGVAEVESAESAFAFD